jgi:hypothetical protein
VGYLRPVKQWNSGKQAEFDRRKTFKVDGISNEKGADPLLVREPPAA